MQLTCGTCVAQGSELYVWGVCVIFVICFKTALFLKFLKIFHKFVKFALRKKNYHSSLIAINYKNVFHYNKQRQLTASFLISSEKSYEHWNKVKIFALLTI